MAHSPAGKTLRLLDAATSRLSSCLLAGQWAQDPVQPGDVVNVFDARDGEGEQHTPHLIVDDSRGFVVALPDTLVTGTRVSQSFDCARASATALVASLSPMARS